MCGGLRPLRAARSTGGIGHDAVADRAPGRRA